MTDNEQKLIQVLDLLMERLEFVYKHETERYYIYSNDLGLTELVEIPRELESALNDRYGLYECEVW